MQAVNLSMGSQPLLTIAIPTYNRAVFLELCLKRISEEIDSLSADQRKLVQVYISNNASTDNTTQVIFQHQLIEARKFEVAHNEENIGGERNVAQCYTSATTPYVWVLGDDDLILPGGLKNVLDVLLEQDVDILYVNNYWFKDDYKNHPRSKEKHGISIYTNRIDFARRTNVMMTFISALIVRNRASLDYHTDVASGSNLPQLGWVLLLLRDGKRFAIIEDWIVAAKGANSGGYGLIKVFGENLKKISNVILKDKPRLAKVIESGTIVNFFPGFILELRSGSSKFQDKDLADGLKQVFGGNWRYYFFLVPLIKLPLFLAYRYNYMLNILRRIFANYLI